MLIRLFIKGEESEDAVLCSKSATFDLQRAETSNTLLLLNVTAATPGEHGEVDGSDTSRMIIPIYSILGSHIEVGLARMAADACGKLMELRSQVHPTGPRLAKLRKLMEETMIEEKDMLLDDAGHEPTVPPSQSPEPFVLPSYPTMSQAERAVGSATSSSSLQGKGSSARKCQVCGVTHKGFGWVFVHACVPRQGYEFSHLLDRIQCSHQELCVALADMRAICVNGAVLMSPVL